MQDRTHFSTDTRLAMLEQEQHWTSEAVTSIQKELHKANNLRTGVLVAIIATLVTTVVSVVLARI